MRNPDKIYLWHGQVILHGSDGAPYVPPSPPTSFYVTYATDQGELSAAFAAHQSGGATPNKRLFLLTQPMNEATRVGMLYTYEGERSIMVVEGGRSHHGHVGVLFNVVRGGGSFAWERDYSEGHPGLFVTGPSSYGNIYRLQRIESDPFGRAVFTIIPLRVVGAVPPVNFSIVEDATLRGEAQEHYRELQAAFSTASSRALVKHISSVVEACLTDRLRSRSISAPRNLAPMLEEVKRLPESGVKGVLNEGGYHSAQTIRLAHQRTHPEAAARTGSPIEPEEALALLQDMKRVLGDLGLIP